MWISAGSCVSVDMLSCYDPDTGTLGTPETPGTPETDTPVEASDPRSLPCNWESVTSLACNRESVTSLVCNRECCCSQSGGPVSAGPPQTLVPGEEDFESLKLISTGAYR